VKKATKADLSPLEIFALKVAAKKCDEVRGRLEPGTHVVDVTVRISGTLSAGESQVAIGVESPPAKTLLGLVLEELGPKTAAKTIAAVRQACAKYVAGGETPTPGDEAKQLGEDLAAACSRPVEKTKAGNVAGVLAATVVARGAGKKQKSRTG
jgi:hypothetical protein